MQCSRYPPGDLEIRLRQRQDRIEQQEHEGHEKRPHPLHPTPAFAGAGPGG